MTAAVITVSDSCAGGQRQDASGPAVGATLKKHGFILSGSEIVPDEQPLIEQAIIKLAANSDVVITTGGTGIGRRDVTPEATKAVCERLVEGIAERMRSEGARSTPLAALSRAICGIRGTTLVLNLPGSPRAATESLAAVADLLPHALELLRGHTDHK
ncbi:MAG: MogA/MoaB family molybdenum cofactor biosynthesis protein [Acidobacteriaceae bacterium]|nr:MogA/MoaB family molybdenum cofactor biosynthesis protein [Acidobacteriaceae bacterium]